MKKIFSILYTAISIGVVSCSANGGDKSPVSETPVNEIPTDTLTEAYALADNGIGRITLGMPVAEIPGSIPGLYDRVDKYDGKSFVGYSFVLDSIETFQAEDTDFDGKINLIALRDGSPLNAITERGAFAIGMPEDSLLADGEKLSDNGGYRIGKFAIQAQDGRISEIYIEWDPRASR